MVFKCFQVVFDFSDLGDPWSLGGHRKNCNRYSVLPEPRGLSGEAVTWFEASPSLDSLDSLDLSRVLWILCGSGVDHSQRILAKLGMSRLI